MSHSFVDSKYHCVFSTKNRTPLLNPELRNRLFPYFRGIAQKNGIRISAVGGTENHIHILLSLPSTMSIAQAVKNLKGASSRWIHITFPDLSFAWQEGYGAFSIGVSQEKSTIQYINRQEEHHLHRSADNITRFTPCRQITPAQLFTITPGTLPRPSPQP